MSNIDYLAITASGEDQVGLVQRFTSRIAEAAWREYKRVTADARADADAALKRARAEFRLTVALARS